MRVLMFGWEFPPHNSGGLGTACYGLTQALLHENIEVIFVLPKKLYVDVPHNMRVCFGMDPASVTTQHFSSIVVSSLLSPYLNTSSYDILYNQEYYNHKEYGSHNIYALNLVDEVLRYAHQTVEIAKVEKYDIIHAHDWLSFPAGIRAKEETGKPLVVHVHATEFDRSGGEGNRRIHAIEKEGLMKADRIIVVSHFTKSLIEKKYGIDSAKITVVHNGVQRKTYNNPVFLRADLHELKKAGNKVVLFLGRLTLQKGPDYFLRIAERVLLHSKKVIFIIAGSGDMEHQILRTVAKSRLSDKIFFTGFARGNNITSLYKMADLYVLPSVSEPFGITPLESLTEGTPVLVSRQSGVAEVLRHALKVDFWDVDAAAHKILTLLDNPALARSLSKNGKKEAHHITWKKAAKKCIDVYKTVV